MSTNLQPKAILANQLVITKITDVSSSTNNMDNVVNIASDELNNTSNKFSDETSNKENNTVKNVVKNELNKQLSDQSNSTIKDELNNKTSSSFDSKSTQTDSFDRTNRVKPNLVKNYQNRNKNNSQRYENKPFRNNNRNNGNSVGNGKVSTIMNSKNNNTSPSLFNRLVDVVPSTFARIEQIYNNVCEGFVYRPNLGFVVNAIIKTGKFNPETIANNICTVFCEKQAKTTRKTPIYLTKDNLEKCREIQAEVKIILDMDIDIHPVLNSMVYTGEFYVQDIRRAVRNFFLDKRKNSSYQKANSYGKPNSYEKANSYEKSRSYQKPKPYQKSKSIN